jgi:hypothetical protein
MARKKLGPRYLYASGEVPMPGDYLTGSRGGKAIVEAIGGGNRGPAGDANGDVLLYLGGGLYTRTGVPNRYKLDHRANAHEPEGKR